MELGYFLINDLGISVGITDENEGLGTLVGLKRRDKVRRGSMPGRTFSYSRKILDQDPISASIIPCLIFQLYMTSPKPSLNIFYSVGTDLFAIQVQIDLH